MKSFLPALLACSITVSSFAQDVRLSDSVIFINNKPVALYSKELSNSTPRYNMEVYSLDDYVLIKAEVVKFNAPVAELRPFYYYELTFPPTGAKFAMYIEDEAFPLVLGKIIRDYDLINKNELNKKNVNRFIKNYYGGPALLAKIKSFEDHLNDTRYFDEQVKRDRTKPVTIINDRIIMQDGVKIGLIAEFKNSTEGNSIPYIYDSSKIGIPARFVYDPPINTTNETQILIYNGRRIDNLRYSNAWSSWSKASKRNLYKVSKSANKRISTYTDEVLMKVCYLIDDYSL